MPMHCYAPQQVVVRKAGLKRDAPFLYTLDGVWELSDDGFEILMEEADVM
jgi:hypothetical protein